MLVFFFQFYCFYTNAATISLTGNAFDKLNRPRFNIETYMNKETLKLQLFFTRIILIQNYVYRLISN